MDQNRTHSKPIVLQEVVALRAVAIVLIVVYHSFIVYNYGWQQPVGFVDVPVYQQTARLAISFSLELFMFVSGYIFGFQNASGKLKTFWEFIQKKATRLLLPSIFFSILYLLFLIDYESYNYVNIIDRVVFGCGHLWFLPTLFIMFCLAYFIVRLPKSMILVVIGMLFCVAPFMKVTSLPFRLSETCYYLPFFLSGFYLFGSRDAILHIGKGHIGMLVFLFAAVYAASQFCWFAGKDSMLTEVQLYKVLAKVLAVICALLGVIASLLIALRASTGGGNYASRLILLISQNSFGIYLLHQFILQILYFHTPFPLRVGPYWLPFCGYVITFMFSLGGSYLLRKTRVGKLLIG